MSVFTYVFKGEHCLSQYDLTFSMLHYSINHYSSSSFRQTWYTPMMSKKIIIKGPIYPTQVNHIHELGPGQRLKGVQLVPKP